MQNAIDKLIDKIKETNNPTVIGLDPNYESLPECIKKKHTNDIQGIAESILEFNKSIIDEIHDIIPAIKPNIAFYEKYGIEGMKVFKDTCDYAKEKGMITIADIKRGDIGHTANAYSKAFLSGIEVGGKLERIFDVDFVTLNPYLGIDGIKPFIEDCLKYNKGVFIIDKTSNKSSGELQDLELKTGEKLYIKVANLIEEWGSGLVGEYGYSSIASVVGATYPEQLTELRKKAPHTFFLIPGFGAQGGKAEDVALGFDENKIGAIVNSSRGLICAYKSSEYNEEDFTKATRDAAIKMREELNLAIQKVENKYE